jgi:hypothetical protein
MTPHTTHRKERTMNRKLAILVGGCVVAVAASLAGCGSGTPKPSVATCTQAYPAWFAASAAAGVTTATPAACKGLSQDQIAQIGIAYLAKQSQ